jgi:hypothetical protein
VKAYLETKISHFKAQGLKPGAFKLWVNWISTCTQPHRVTHVGVVVGLEEGQAGVELVVAVQVDPFESKL